MEDLPRERAARIAAGSDPEPGESPMDLNFLACLEEHGRGQGRLVDEAVSALNLAQSARDKERCEHRPVPEEPGVEAVDHFWFNPYKEYRDGQSGALIAHPEAREAMQE